MRGWIIDRDVLAEDCPEEERPKAPCNDNAVGMVGPSSYKGDGSDLTHKFRMLDDDGEVMYEGRSASCDDEDAFGPLDDFGEPNAGATRIDYLRHNADRLIDEWVQL